MEISELIRYHDRQYIVFAKPPGLPVQEDLSGDPSLLRMAQAYCKHDLILWNRLDRPVSGLVVFSKTHIAIQSLNLQQKEGQISKLYLAAVRKPVTIPTDTLIHHLKKLRSGNKSIVFDQFEKGTKQCQLSYEVVAESEQYALLKVTLNTGRHHQIRAQLGYIGIPVKGDVKYGFRRANKDRSIHLHAWKITFTHATKKIPVTVITRPPDDVVWNAFEYKYF